MPNTTLSTEDAAWLESHSNACKSACEFILADLFQEQSRAANKAREVLIWYQNAYMRALDLSSLIEDETPYSQIYEQWRCRVYERVMRVCRSLSGHEARALTMVSGFADIGEETLYDDADDAVSEARAALYAE